MKIVIIIGVLSFILAIASTMFFGGSFSKGLADGTEAPIDEQTPSDNQAELKNIQEQITKAKQELQNYRAEIAKEKAKLEAMRSDTVGTSKPAQNIVELVKDSDVNKTETTQTGLKQTVKLFSSMKPSEAAVILCEMDENLTRKIVSEMDTKTAGKIMTALAETNPTYAAKVSKAMLNTGKGASF